MKEQTIYISEDGRSFESSEDCLEWEVMLVEIRVIRERLWERAKNWCIKSRGHYEARKIYGDKCTDEMTLLPAPQEDHLVKLVFSTLGNSTDNIKAENLKALQKSARDFYEVVYGVEAPTLNSD